jgi:hypothetical protein
LGVNKAYADVRAFLTPVCDQHAAGRPKPFSCWAALKMKDLKQQAVAPKPDEPSNPFHSELNLDDYRKRQHAELLAFKLSTLAWKEDRLD